MKMQNKKKFFYFCILSLISIVSVAFAFTACNDTHAFSKYIFVRDFSETYTVSVKVNVKNHTEIWDRGYDYFEYNKGVDALYAKIMDTPPNNAYVTRKGDLFFVDEQANGRIYSCIIYPSEEKNTFLVHSMTYTLGEWANNMAIFFPAYTLDKPIDCKDSADTVYKCSLKIDALAQYYEERGYMTSTNSNVLKIVCMLRYPSKFPGELGSFGHKAVSWSIIYESESSIRFADVSDGYEF